MIQIKPNYDELNLQNISKASITTLVQQIEWCHYKAVGGMVEMNIAFIELVKRAKKSEELQDEVDRLEHDWNYEHELAIKARHELRENS